MDAELSRPDLLATVQSGRKQVQSRVCTPSFRHPEMALQATFRTGSIFEACDDLLETGDGYSAEENHRARAVVRIVLASVPQLLVFANFLRMMFLAPVFALVLAMWSLYVRHRSRVTPM